MIEDQLEERIALLEEWSHPPQDIGKAVRFQLLQTFKLMEFLASPGDTFDMVLKKVIKHLGDE